MKFILTLALIHFSLTGSGQIIVNGMIKHYDGKSAVYYTPTVEGVIPIAGGMGQAITPNARGRFRIQIENKGYGTLKLSFNGLTFAFFHDDDTEINLVIDQDRIKFPSRKRNLVRDSLKQVATISIGGDFAEVNRYYNRMPRSSTMTLSVEGTHLSRLIEKIETSAEVIAFIDSLTQNELSEIRSLGTAIGPDNLDPGGVTPEVKRFLENQVHAFYGSIFLSGMMLKRFAQGNRLNQEPGAPLTIYHREWEKLVEQFFSQVSRKVFPAANSFEYNEFIFALAYAQDYYRKYDFTPPAATHDQLVMERLVSPKLPLLDSLSLLDDKTLLAYKLQNLARFLDTQTFWSPVLLNAISEMKKQYPESEYMEWHEPQVEKLKTYLKTTALDYDKARIVETNYLRFSDLLAAFKGQYLFIDVWATWCGPCVDDFNYKSVLKPFVDAGKITVLYISIDKPVWRKKWKENMKYNQLEGYHVLANDVLIQDMWDFLGGRAGSIPRYALIDKDGSLFSNDCPRPREGEALVAEITRMVSK